MSSQFNGPISGRNVIRGMSSVGGTTTINLGDETQITTTCSATSLDSTDNEQFITPIVETGSHIAPEAWNRCSGAILRNKSTIGPQGGARHVTLINSDVLDGDVLRGSLTDSVVCADAKLEDTRVTGSSIVGGRHSQSKFYDSRIIGAKSSGSEFIDSNITSGEYRDCHLNEENLSATRTFSNITSVGFQAALDRLRSHAQGQSEISHKD
jgi:uncharacterized protein YjbI with pentapeptide repeats